MTSYDDPTAPVANAPFMARNPIHLARMLKDAAGVPAHGDQRRLWDKGERFDHPNPEYR